jgi:hypothetical protein
MPKFESSAAPALPDRPKPKLTVIEGGKGKPKTPERWSPDELLKPNMPKPRAHGSEKPIDVAAVMREDEQKQEEIRRKISQIKMPKPKAAGMSDDRWSADEVLKPNMPKPRAHGAEAPVDIGAIMRSDAELEAATAERPRKKVGAEDLPKPKAAGMSDDRWSADEVLKPNMPKPRAHGAEAPVDLAEVMRSEAGPVSKKERANIVLPKPRGYEEPIELGEEDLEVLEEEAPPSKPPRRPPSPPPSFREAA